MTKTYSMYWEKKKKENINVEVCVNAIIQGQDKYEKRLKKD